MSVHATTMHASTMMVMAMPGPDGGVDPTVRTGVTL
jgi:hypothetical protein